jgi:hypothetical protein
LQRKPVGVEENGGALSLKLDMAVGSDGRVIGTPVGHPVRRNPIGVSSVVCDGRVYPRCQGNYDDIADETHTEAEFPAFVEDAPEVVCMLTRAAPRRATLISKWSVEHNRYGTFLVFHAENATAASVIDLIEGAGLRVKRWGASTRLGLWADGRPASGRRHSD